MGKTRVHQLKKGEVLDRVSEWYVLGCPVGKLRQIALLVMWMLGGRERVDQSPQGMWQRGGHMSVWTWS